MAMRDIEKILAAEAEADKVRDSGAKTAADIISAAEAEGKAKYDDTIADAVRRTREARAEFDELMKDRNEKARLAARVEAERCRVIARERIDEAADFICGWIVKG